MCGELFLVLYACLMADLLKIAHAVELRYFCCHAPKPEWRRALQRMHMHGQECCLCCQIIRRKRHLEQQYELCVSAIDVCTLISFAAAMPLWYGGDDVPDQSNRTIIITGGTSGLGLSTAKSLTSRGAQVVITGRSPAKGDRSALASHAGTLLVKSRNRLSCRAEP